MEPSTLLAIIARKPRVWGESPIRGDFPCNVRDLLDRMGGRERAALIDDIRNAADSHGFAAAAGAVSAIIDAGRPIDRAGPPDGSRRATAPSADRTRPATTPTWRNDDDEPDGTGGPHDAEGHGRTGTGALPEPALTRSVLRRAVGNATPGQLGFLADLLEAENASRAESRRARLPRAGRVPPEQEPRRLRPGHGLVPPELGARTAHEPRIRRPRRGPRALRRRGMRQDPPRHRRRIPRLPTRDPGQVPPPRPV